MGESGMLEADDLYERRVFHAKVYAAIRAAEREADFLHFQVYRMRVFDNVSGKEVADQLGISEPTVSRHLARVRLLLRDRLAEVVATYSFTDEERREVDVAGLGGNDDRDNNNERQR